MPDYMFKQCNSTILLLFKTILHNTLKPLPSPLPILPNPPTPRQQLSTSPSKIPSILPKPDFIHTNQTPRLCADKVYFVVTHKSWASTPRNRLPFTSDGTPLITALKNAENSTLCVRAGIKNFLNSYRVSFRRP